MKKSKGQAVDLLYTNNRNKKNKKKDKVKKEKKIKENVNSENEIIIGLTPKQESKPKNNKKNKPKKNKDLKERNNKKNIKKIKPQKKKKIKKKKNKFIKWIIIIIIIIIAIILFLRSSIFNIKQIVVVNNKKVSSQEIINLSTLTIEENIFKKTNKKIREGIKTNAYIENVKIKRNFNGTITLEIEERTPTYMLKFANINAYINNQGYILETSEKDIEVPVISGISTPEEEIKAGNRLAIEDLQRLEDIIKIMESAKSVSMEKIITKIDILDSSKYKLEIASEGKTVQFGEATNINIKFLKIKALIEQEKGIKGEIYFQDQEKTVFREKV